MIQKWLFFFENLNFRSLLKKNLKIKTKILDEMSDDISTDDEEEADKGTDNKGPSVLLVLIAKKTRHILMQ